MFFYARHQPDPALDIDADDDIADCRDEEEGSVIKSMISQLRCVICFSQAGCDTVVCSGRDEVYDATPSSPRTS